MDLAETLITVVFTAVITNLVTRFSRKEEIERTKTQTIQSVVDLWKGLVQDLTRDMKELTQEVEQLRSENKSLKLEMRKLEKLLNETNKS